MDLAIVTYLDESGNEVTQLAIVGDNNVNLLDSRPLGITRKQTPQGAVLAGWLRDGILQAMGKKE